VSGPVTVYLSLPLTGPAAAGGNDAADGARLALEQAGGRAGELEVEAEVLDDAAGARWDPVLVGENARAATADSSTAAYIGELESEPTRASAPITNEGEVAQVSPGASAVDLTQAAEGYPDSPERYQPSGDVTFARNVPADSEVLRAAAERGVELGVRTVALDLGDDSYGRLSAEEFERQAALVGLEVVPGAGADAVLRVDERGFLLDGPQRISFAPPLAAERLASPGFGAEFADRFGRDPGPFAAYGYDAMQLVLGAITEAEGESEFRIAVRDAILGAERPDSVLGRYSIGDDGDTTLCAIQPYELGAGSAGVPGEPICPGG
jgi:branched-chain amino acid transport system substrate-binding protein